MANEETSRKILIAVPFIMTAVLILCVFFGLRFGAERSMDEYIAFYGGSFDYYSVEYSDKKGEPLRTVDLYLSNTTGAITNPKGINVRKSVYSFKDKQSAKDYAEKLAKSQDREITVLDRYVVTIPKKYAVADDDYKEKYNQYVEMLQRTSQNENMYKFFVAFGEEKIN